MKIKLTILILLLSILTISAQNNNRYAGTQSILDQQNKLMIKYRLEQTKLHSALNAATRLKQPTNVYNNRLIWLTNTISIIKSNNINLSMRYNLDYYNKSHPVIKPILINTNKPIVDIPTLVNK